MKYFDRGMRYKSYKYSECLPDYGFRFLLENAFPGLTVFVMGFWDVGWVLGMMI